MPCPNAARLKQDIARYRKAGADRVVSMLAKDEAASLGLADEGAACANVGIAFIHRPIADFGLPDVRQFEALVRQINTWLEAGQGICVHCRAGIGRSGMVCAGILVLQGLSATQAIEKVTHARGVSIPDTVEQGNFITAFESDTKGRIHLTISK